MKVTICILQQFEIYGEPRPKCEDRYTVPNEKRYGICKEARKNCTYYRTFNVEDPKIEFEKNKTEIPLEPAVTMQTL